MPNAEQYDLRSPQLPRLAGKALRLSVRLLEAGITRAVLIRRLLRQAGVAALRELAVDEEPTFRPFAPGAARRP